MMKSRWLRVLALLLGLSLIAAACGDDDDTGDNAGNQTTTTADQGGGGGGAGGGEFIDGSTFVGDPPEHIDPALNSTLNAYQVINAMYDGLTDLDFSGDTPKVVPHLAESIEPNDDATVWTFTLKDGLQFSNGEAITPTTFKRSWERAAAMGGDYSYLMTFIDGGKEALDNPGSELTGVKADDENNTLEVTLSAPYSNFDAVAGFQLFFPMPEEAGDAANPVADYENGMMIGNGPYKLESARSDQEIVLVKNDSWNGDFNGETWDGRLDKIVFTVQADPDTAYNAFEAGEVDSGQIPPARTQDARDKYANTLDVSILGSYHWIINQDGMIGGPDNVKLRQAISAAIDRDQINQAVYNGARKVSTGIVPPGIPGFKENICEYCKYDPDQAKQLYQEWKDAGGTLDGPIPLQFNADAGHEPVVQIMIDNLKAIGIEAEASPMPTETYFSTLAKGGCEAMCRAGWFADYPTYDNFMYDLFHSDSIGGNNYAQYSSEKFDSLVSEAKQTTDPDKQAELFNQAEEQLLNVDTYAVPLNWYLGDKVWNDKDFSDFIMTNQGLILWEQITANS